MVVLVNGVLLYFFNLVALGEKMEFFVKWLSCFLAFIIVFIITGLVLFAFCKLLGLAALYEFLFATELPISASIKFVLGFSGICGFIYALEA